MVEVGKMKWFGGYNSKTGRENNYGFIARRGQSDLYVHKIQLRCQPSDLVAGTPVKFDIGLNPRNSREEAKNLQLLQLQKETDPSVLKVCFEYSDRSIWKPILNKYLLTLPKTTMVATVLERIRSLRPQDREILAKSLLPDLLISPGLKEIRDILPADRHLQLCQQMLPTNPNIQISQEFQNEIIDILATPVNSVDPQLMENLKPLIKNNLKIKLFFIKYNLDKLKIKYLYHMTHISNLKSILTHGLLSHNNAHKYGLVETDISMSEAQQYRRQWHDCVPFYFNPRNTMLYKRREHQNEIVILGVDPMLILQEGAYFSNGNVASMSTKLYNDISMLKNLPWQIINSSSWNREDPGQKANYKRIMCAEVLVPERVDVQSILKIFCRRPSQISNIQQCIPDGVNIPVEPRSSLYFF